MAKKSKYPKFRKHVKNGRAGQTWISYWYDMRGTGEPDISLGTDYDQALKKWAEIHLNSPLLIGTLEEAFAGWEERGLAVRPNGKPRSAETITGYRKCLRELRGPFGRARWEEVTLPVLKKYVNKRSAKTRARKEMEVLSVIWGWARLEGLTKLPWPAVDMQKTGWKGAPGVREMTVTDQAFATIYKHADQTLKDAMDIASATGLRGNDVVELRLEDVMDGGLINRAGKTGKVGEFDLSASTVLQPIIDRRSAMKKPEHNFILAAGRKKVTYRALAERFTKARAAAAAEMPECAAIWLRDMRKYASQLSPTLSAASELLQHSSLAITRRHYRGNDKLTPVR